MSALAQFALNVRYAFRPAKPLLTARLAWAVVRAKVLGRPRLRYVDFAVNFACNLSCEHCFAKSLHGTGPKRPTMRPADYARVARECMALGAVNFSFQGGEPLLCKELPDIIRACKPDKNVISVTTNGTLLTKERVRQLRDLGVDILTVSLDSALDSEHDAFRGMDGALEKTKAGVDLALEAGLNVTIGTVVTHDTLRSPGIAGLVDYATRKKILLYFILPVPAGNWKANTAMLLTDEDMAYIQNLTATNMYIRTDFQANLGPYGCGAAKEILYLTPYGDVLPCPFMHIRFGNIFQDTVKAIRQRMLENPYLGVYHQKCLVSTDQQFIDRHLSRTYQEENLPMDHTKAFSRDGAS